MVKIHGFTSVATAQLVAKLVKAWAHFFYELTFMATGQDADCNKGYDTDSVRASSSST